MRSASGEFRPGALTERLCRGPGDSPGRERYEENISALGPGSQGAPRFSCADGDQEWPQGDQSSARPGAQAPVGLTGSSAPLPLSTLKRRRDFLACARARRWAAPALLLQARRRGDEEAEAGSGIRVGYTCSKKIGNAVLRNRAKRRLRAASALVLPEAGRPGWDYVLVGRPQATIARSFADLVADLRSALGRVHSR